MDEKLEELLRKLSDKKIKAAEAFEMIRDKLEPKKQYLKATEAQKNGTSSVAINNSKDKIEITKLLKKIKGFLVEQIATVLKVSAKDIDTSINFLDLGVESMLLIQLAETFEMTFNIKLYPTLFFEYKNVEDLAAYFLNTFQQEFIAYFNTSKS